MNIHNIYNYTLENSNFEIFSLSLENKTLLCGVANSEMLQIQNNSLKQKISFSKKLGFSKNPNENNRLYCIKSLTDGTSLLGYDAFLIKKQNNQYTYSYIFPIKSIEQIDDENIIVGTGGYTFKLRLSDLKIIDTIWRERTTKAIYYNQYYYIGTINGLYKVALDKTYEYLGDKHPLLRRRIVDMKISDNGVIWVATSDEGVIGFKENKIVATVTEKNGLSSNICKTLFLNNKYLWIGTNQGLNKIDISNNIYPLVKYSINDGLPSNIINAIQIFNDSIYVGTPLGLTYFKENEINTTSICKLNLLKVINGDSVVNNANVFQVKYNNNSISFHFVGVSMRSQGDMLYYYKLKGLDKNWNSTVENSLKYQVLPYGNYQLEIYAVNKFGVKSNVLLLNIEVQSPFYRKWWFYVLSMSTLMYIVWYITSIQKNKKIKKEVEKNILQRQFAELEQQALQSQMNPHFILNCLNSIQQFILTNDKAKANQYLTEFAALIRQTLELSQIQSTTVNEEISYLKRYLSMEKMRFGDTFEYTITQCNEQLTGHLQIPTLLLQPYVENSLRHGIRHKENNKGNINIHFEKLNSNLLCTITDNGIGRKRAATFKSLQGIEYQSFGMSLTAKRIELLNKMKNTQIKVEIIDLLDDIGKGIGTKVIINFLIEEIE
jgi:sensor histidine kinase YesM